MKAHNFYQHSLFAALMKGELQGSITFKTLLQHGDFGLGTFAATDGELIILDNQAYQILASGSIQLVTEDMTSPFATVTNFVCDQKLTFQNISFSTLKTKLLAQFPSLNLFYALKISGTFATISMRTLKKQKPPFVTLKAAAKDQEELVLENVSGDLVAFWAPEFANMMLVAGFHAHFISSDRKSGGHVFDFQAQELLVEICYLTQMNLSLPLSKSFLALELADSDLQADIKQVESQRKDSH